MYNAQANECRTREAESLEQAKQTSHKELKHLHETIAQQWRRLAEVIEGGRGNTPLPVQSGRDIPLLGGKADPAPDTPHALSVELHDEISETDHDPAKELSAGPEGITSLQHEISEIDLTVAQLGLFPECFASMEEQSSEIHRGAAQSSLWAEGIERPNDPISEAGHGLLSGSASADDSPTAHRQSPEAGPRAVPLGLFTEDFPSLPEQTSDLPRDVTQINSRAEAAESSNDPISNADHRILSVSARADSSRTAHRQSPEAEPGTVPLGFPEDFASQQEQVLEALRDISESDPEGIETLNDQTRETDQDAGCLKAGMVGSQGPDDQILQLDPGAPVDPVPERIARPDDQISEAGQHATELSPGAEGVESLSQIAAQLGAGADNPISEIGPGAAQPTPPVDSVQSLDHPISETDRAIAHLSPGSERIECPDNRISENVHSTMRDNPTAESAKSTVAQISETDHPGAPRRSTGPIETPLEWILSFWLKGGGRN